MTLFRHTLLLSTLSFLLFAAAQCQAPPKSRVKVGDHIPAFTLKDQNGKPLTVADYTGKKILVIYFYPKDESSVCTKEACAFRDKYADFTAKGALVIGINSGSVESHRSFQTNHQLPFVLLSDTGNVVLKKFGVKGAFGLTGRQTYVVDLNGKVVYTFNSMLEGKKHVDEALTYVDKIGVTK